MKIKLLFIVLTSLALSTLFAQETKKLDGESQKTEGSEKSTATVSLEELRKKADDFSKKTGVFNTKGYYLGMPWQEAYCLNKIYGINVIFAVETSDGNVKLKSPKNLEAYVNTLIFRPDDIMKLYSYDGSTSDFCEKFLKSYTKKSFIIPDYKMGNSKEYLGYLEEFIENKKSLITNESDEVSLLQFVGAHMKKMEEFAEKRAEVPYFYYLYTMKDGTVLRFYSGLYLMMKKNLKQKTTGDFD